MKGAVILEKEVELRDFPDPQPGTGQVLVRLKATTLCGSDLHLYNSTRKQREAGRNTWGYIGGHESCGIVEKLGENTKGLAVGDRVIVYHIEGCGYCKYCTAGWMLHCVNEAKVSYGYDANGGLAPFMVANDINCVKLPDQLSFADGACCACGTGTAYQALRRLGVSGRDRFVAYGLGPVGLSGVMLAKAMGAQVIGVDVVQERVEMAARLGAKLTINASQDDPVRLIRQATEGEGAETTADFSGNPQARCNALDSARIWGRVAFVGEGNTLTVSPSPQIISRQLTIVGSWVYGISELNDLLNFLVVHDLHPENMITHRFPLDDVKQAFSTFNTRKSGKVLVEFAD